MNKTQKKIVALLKHKNEDISINQIADEIGVDRHTAARHLATLEGMGVCACRAIGKSKLWKLTASPLLSVIESDSPLKTELESLLSTLDDKIHIQDKDHIIKWANHENFKGQKCHQVLAGSDEPCSVCAVAKVFESGVMTESKCNNHVLISKPILDADNKTIAVLNVLKE